MKIFSEKTNKYYATVDECLEAEKKHDEAIAVKEAKKKELSETRKVPSGAFLRSFCFWASKVFNSFKRASSIGSRKIGESCSFSKFFVNCITQK